MNLQGGGAPKLLVAPALAIAVNGHRVFTARNDAGRPNRHWLV